MRADFRLLTLLGILTVGLLFTACASSPKEPVVFTSALYKLVTDGDCDTTFTGKPYKLNIAKFSFFSWEDNSVQKLFQWAEETGLYDLSAMKHQDLRMVDSDFNNYEKGLNRNELILMCNILSDMDGLEPVYCYENGQPVRSTWNSREVSVYTDMAANGWFVPAYYRDIYFDNQRDEYSYRIAADSQNRLVIFGRTNTYVFDTIENNSPLTDWIERVYVSNDYGSRAMSLRLPICRKATRYTDTMPLIDGVQLFHIAEGFGSVQTGYHGDFFYLPDMKVLYVKNGSTREVFCDIAKRFAAKGIPFDYPEYASGMLIDKYTQFIDFSRLTESQLLCVANMLSEYEGLVPAYTTLDGQVVRQTMDDVDRQTYESHTSGWHYVTNNHARNSYYGDVIISLLELNGIDVDYTNDLILYCFE